MALLRDVLIKKPKKSNFDLSRKNRFTMAPGLLYPVFIEDVLPGDEISLSADALIKTYPLNAPLMGSFKFQLDYFFVPWRLYVPDFAENKRLYQATSVGQINDVELPYINWFSNDDEGFGKDSYKIAAAFIMLIILSLTYIAFMQI